MTNASHDKLNAYGCYNERHQEGRPGGDHGSGHKTAEPGGAPGYHGSVFSGDRIGILLDALRNAEK